MATQQGAKVGIGSRIDYGSEGFRDSIVKGSFGLLQTEETNYNILLGGLVSKNHIAQRIKKYVEEQIAKAKARSGRGGAKLSAADVALLKQQFYEQEVHNIAVELSKIIPINYAPDPEDVSKKVPVDLFIATSPAFDGEVGEVIANELAELRSDIRVWNIGGDRFTVKYVDKLIWGLTPKKAVWMRGDYYSTAVERVIKDKIKQTAQSSPDLYAVGCFGSSINKPKGELKYAYVAVPVMHRLESTRVNENQIGVSVLEFPADDSQHLFSTYSLKDLVSKELSYIIPPEGASALQVRMIEVMKSRGSVTPGILKYQLQDALLDDITKEMSDLIEDPAKQKTIRRRGENWPGVRFEEKSKKYYFNLDWIQNKLKYPALTGPWNEDRIMDFCCVHAGSIETDLEFFVNEVPVYILKTGATILVNAGDTKEGMKHSLFTKGEVIAGMNNTKQEKFAALIIAEVIFRVFVTRFTQLVQDVSHDELNVKKLAALINQAVLLYVYILGNHDLWETEDGNDPLELFHRLLVSHLAEYIFAFLVIKNVVFPYEQLLDIVESKVQKREFFSLPSGLKASVQHPHMSRAKTTSLRPQEMLEFAKRFGCQVAIGGNFHVAENVEEWDMDLGQCVCQQVGTIKHGSNFERHKMKMVDQGIGFLRILSSRNKEGEPRIFMTQSAFYGAPRMRDPIDNLSIVNPFLEKLGLKPIK